MIAFTNVRIFDGESADPAPGTVVVDGDQIVSVGDAPAPPQAEMIDGGGRTLMPGLIDAHIHAYAIDVNIQRVMEAPPTLLAHWAARVLENMIDRGFTSVRDTGGADYGLFLAIERGLIKAPRLFYCEKALSQTGGHGDFRHHHHYDGDAEHLVACGCGVVNFLAYVVDGVDKVRQAVRENIRRGSSFIKLMGSGGVASPSDPLDRAQFSDEEIRAIVDEVNRAGVYCTAHIHPDHALKRAIMLGVHCIEHGTLIEPDTARLAAERGTYIVPTLAVISALANEGAALGFPPESLRKLDMVKDQAVARLQHMKDAGVKVGFGTDLLGKLERYECTEFALRAAVFSPLEILRQATSMNAEIVGQKGRLGVIRTGALADILLVDGDPVADLTLLERDGAALPVIMKGGRFHKRTI
ncbi:MAG: amidohydrolase family protein [Gemmatimonadota bacterium]